MMDWMKREVSAGITSRFAENGEVLDFHLRNQERFVRSLQNLAKRLEVEPNQIICGRQPHGVKILRVDESEAEFFLREGYDGYITNCAQVVLATFHADCVPIYFFDPRREVIGLAHGGWRGTAAGIAGKMVDRMRSEYGTRPEELMVRIGPCISQNGYEVDLPVIQACKAVTQMIGIEMRSDTHANLDLSAIHFEILLRKGVKKERISVDSRKTDLNSSLYYSHRKEGESAGRMLAWIKLKDKFGNV